MLTDKSRENIANQAFDHLARVDEITADIDALAADYALGSKEVKLSDIDALYSELKDRLKSLRELHKFIEGD
jgi:3-oxoacyl-[acyl-carrier-protein] synthase III